jgi:endoglucanase
MTASGFEAIDPFEQVKQMGRGLNILWSDPLWQNVKKARFKERHFQRLQDGGFQSLRVDLQAFSHMDAENRLDPAWLKTLDWVVNNALANHLNVILDEHDYTRCGTNAALCRTKLLAFWEQVAPRYRDAPNGVIYEILNEPNRQLTVPAWNSLLKETLAVIRKTNPTRNVIIGPASWSNVSYLEKLELPADDRHIIVTVHYYTPMEFTHQGAHWVKWASNLSGVTWMGTDAEKRRVDEDFAGVQQWSKKEGRPIFLGEFGAYEKGDLDSRVRYISYVARAAESQGWAWAYWQFDSSPVAYDVAKDNWLQPRWAWAHYQVDVGFIVYDMAKDDWVQPIWKALVP